MGEWFKGVYRRQLADMHISDSDDAFLAQFNEDEYFYCLEKAKIQSPMIYLQSHTGLCNFPTKVARTHKFFIKKPNALKNLIDKCQQAGMKVVGYYSLIFNNLAQEMHPEWAMRYHNGDTWQDRGQRYGLCCPNNEKYRGFVVEQIKEMAQAYPKLEGVFFDMPYWEIPCHCSACQNRWEKEIGGEMPSDIPDWKNPAWLRYVKARQDWMVDFARYVRESSKQYYPDSTIEFNFAAVIGSDWLGGSTEDINKESEFTGGDLYGDLYSHSFASKYYYGVTNNQPFEYMTCRCNRNLREHTITKPQEILEQEIALTSAHHGATLNIDAINPDGSLDCRVYEKLGKAFEKQMLYEPYMDKGKLYGEVAVYFDSKTQFDGGEGTYNKICANNAHKTLVENHIPTCVIANGNLNCLEDYQMVIAPCLQDFDNDEVLKFIDYVKNGGCLYLSGKSDRRLIKAFFEGEIKNYTYGDSPYTHVYKGYDEVQAYVSPCGEWKEVFGEFNEKYPLPITYKLPIISDFKGEVLAKIVLPYSDPDDNTQFASIHSNPPWKETETPAILQTKFGKGKVIWSTAFIEKDMRKNFQDIFIGIIKKNISSLFSIQTSKYAESVVFKDGKNDYYISLVDICDETTERKTTIALQNGTDFEIIDLPKEEVVYEGKSYQCTWDKWIMFRLKIKR